MSDRKMLVTASVLSVFLLFSAVSCSKEATEIAKATAHVAPTSTVGIEISPIPTPIVATELTEPTPTSTPVPSLPKEVYVTASDGLRVRTGPGLDYEKIKTEPLNSVGTIIEGPTAVDGYVWWKVRYADGVEGWSAQDWLAFGTPPAESVVAAVPPAQHVCDFSKPVDLRPATTYDMFGRDEYDTLVCGYAKFVEENAGEEGNWASFTAVYLVIVDYADGTFHQVLSDTIGGPNKKGPFGNEFNLGCYIDGRIIGGEYPDSNPYIDEATETAILNSTPDNLVSLVLSFGYHPGRGCVCCNLAHKVRLY